MSYGNRPPLASFPPSPGNTGAPDEPSARERIARIKSITRRAVGHWKVASILFLVGAIVAVAVAWSSTRMYRSECVVQFRAGLKMGERDDDSPGERASKLGPKLRERLTTRTRLELVIKEFDLYPKTVSSQGMLWAVDDMRDKHVGFRQKDSDAFVISFENEDPEVAQKVTQRLADTMINEFTTGNLEQAKQQDAFLMQEEQRSAGELETASRNVAKFLSVHPEFAVEIKQGGGVAPRGRGPRGGGAVKKGAAGRGR
jgi:uncharacterized protein involved in exopolysaccharide biosynthesis